MRATEKRRFKDELFEQFARIGKALSSGRRLELVELLAQAERSVEDLAAETSQVCGEHVQHLQVLRQAQLVVGRRARNYIRYRLADENVLASLACDARPRAGATGRGWTLVETYLTDRSTLEPVGCAELQRRLKDGSAIVLDVRPTDEFAAGHISGARSIPVDELRARIEKCPRSVSSSRIAAAPTVFSQTTAVELLRSAGYQAFRLDGGFPDWQTRGMPVESNRIAM